MVEVSNRKSAVPAGAAPVVISTMRKRRRVNGAPVLLRKRRLIESVPFVPLVIGVKSRTRAQADVEAPLPGQFGSMKEALTDEAYKTQESFYGNSGISWFERWTLAQGKKLREEPKVDEEVQKIWDEKNSKK